MNSSRSVVRFPGAFGTNLAARLDLPSSEPRAFALFAHCFTCSKDTLAASRISYALATHGVGAPDGAQRARLLEIADRCPVHRTLHAEVRVQTRLAG